MRKLKSNSYQFMDFLLSEEGQRIYLSENMQPARRGFVPPWVPKNLKFHFNDPKIGDKFRDYQKLFGEIFDGSDLMLLPVSSTRREFR